MRAILRRRRLVVIFIAVGAIGAALAWVAWRGERSRVRPPAFEGNPSLLLVVARTSPEGVLEGHRLLGVPFVDGTPGPPELIYEGPEVFFGNLMRVRFVAGRYVVTDSAGVIDLATKEVIRQAGGRLVEATEGRVVFRVYNTERAGIYAFAFQSGKEERLRGADEAEYELPGTRSPDGSKSVRPVARSLILYRATEPPLPFARQFHIEQSRLPSGGGSPAVLWLGPDRILTEDGKGQLAAMSLDGTRLPVVNVPVSADAAASAILWRDPAGQIIYKCGPEEFVIDVEAKSCAKREWAELGSGFALSMDKDWRGRFVVRHRGEEVGRFRGQVHILGRTAAGEDCLAVIGERSEPGIWVWSAGATDWVALNVQADHLLGWVK